MSRQCAALCACERSRKARRIIGLSRLGSISSAWTRSGDRQASLLGVECEGVSTPVVRAYLGGSCPDWCGNREVAHSSGGLSTHQQARRGNVSLHESAPRRPSLLRASLRFRPTRCRLLRLRLPARARRPPGARTARPRPETAPAHAVCAKELATVVHYRHLVGGQGGQLLAVTQRVDDLAAHTGRAARMPA